ncbi:XRE family transcriptional regulator [Lachnoanaerobaculum orale]|uniref:XRE family transcriptional regulator n=1 Tax=Lachnoanaerobaculum orale TaxID=979627 RepID=A0A3P3Q1I2_9FIRM|nr:helix-turn-helix domain-containing protein [Lachnoanaerobaculum orale]RRJ14130.1 XRE family transcriptional regulator [Lachnoanaerobaculum orale]
MEDTNKIGGMIKRFIKNRNRTEKQIAGELGIKNTTFSAQLSRDTVSAETLFRLSVLLDIDLNWMKYALGYHGQVGFLEREQIPRMQEEFRENERKFVLHRMDDLINANPGSTADVRRELLKEFHCNMFYLLDVLVPDEFELFLVVERGVTKYYVDTKEMLTKGMLSCTNMRRKPIACLKDGNNALNIVIEDRKDEICI